MDPHQFFIPLRGRLVVGDVHNKRSKDHEGKPVPYEDQGYNFGIAYPKAEFKAWADAELWPYWSQAVGQNADALNRLTQFWGQFGAKGIISAKIYDGDIPNQRNGKVNDNTAGHYVISFNTYGQGGDAQQPAVVAGPTAEQLVQIDISQLKRGDYVTISGSTKFNGKSGNQLGFYMNANSIWKLEDGPAIQGGGDPTAGFAGAGLTGNYDPSQGHAVGFGAAPVPDATTALVARHVQHAAPQAPQAPQPPAAPAAPQAPQPPAAPAAPHVPPQPPATHAAPVPAQTAPAAPQAQAGVPPVAQQATASPGNPPAQPYYGAMEPTQPPAQGGVTPPPPPPVQS